MTPDRTHFLFPLPKLRRRSMFTVLCTIAIVPSLVLMVASSSRAFQQNNNDSSPNPSGLARTFNVNGALDLSNPFFQDIGTNGRRCMTCHQPDQGWAISAAGVRARFEATDGLDPIFRLNDGCNSPLAAVSTKEERRASYSMLLTKGLIRVGLPIPPGAEFELVACDDPYGYSTAQEISCYRRPLPTTNLRFLTTVMWDGRESHPGFTLAQNLAQQASDATTGHAMGADVSSSVRDQIVQFEMGLFTAQAVDIKAGQLDAQGGNGGPHILSKQLFYTGINDVLGADPNGLPFDSRAMTLYNAWIDLKPNSALAAARKQIARGQELFNSKPIAITGVKGLNDALGIPVIQGFCTSCHDSPNVGHHSVPLPIDIGLAASSRRTPDLPLYTLRRLSNGETIQVTDPGRALVTGKWSDIGKFKGPILRALAARAPYFHNGSADTLDDVVNFYDERFAIGFTASEKADLAAFLRTL